MSTRVAIFILVSVLWFNDGMSQIIQVLEENSREPISGSAVYNLDKSKSGITDFDGYVDISDFSDSENIYFQHISHIQTFFTKSDIITSGNVVYLTMDASTLDEVVLAISKFGLRKKDLPQQVVTVTSDDIRLSNPQTAADLLESS